MAGERAGILIRSDAGPGVLHELTGVIASHNGDIALVEILESQPPYSRVYFEVLLAGDPLALGEVHTSL